MLVLVETPAGFALFKLLDEAKLNQVDDIWKEFETPAAARQIVKLKSFHKFENTAEALGAATAIVESKLSKGLKKFLKAECQGQTLAIADSKLGRIITEKLEISCIHNNGVMELLRGVRSQLADLVEGLSNQDLASMSLGLSHSLCRYTLKFSPDKVDTMIVQAIGLLDDLDKELNTYAMRVREWYGWHFPELAKIVTDNIQYAKSVKLMKKRVNAPDLDFSEILEEEVEVQLKEAVPISMGTDITEEDMDTIQEFCDQVISLAEYRTQLYDYLRSRMKAIAPNLTVLVGELVGARLIAHAGSLINLSKQPASTVQILGAEKALFRALKTKQNTPKYGLIYHASLVGQAPAKFKGKIARVLAAKTALSIRYDALGEGQDANIGIENRAKVEARLRQLEGRALGKASGAAKGKAKIEAYDKDRKGATPGLLTAAKTYETQADITLGGGKREKRKKKDQEEEAPATEEPPKKKKRTQTAEEDAGASAEPETLTPKKKKSKKDKSEEAGASTPLVEKVEAPAKEKKSSKKEKKSKGKAQEEDPAREEEPEKKKKKKKQMMIEEVEAAAPDSRKKKQRKE
ncbi:hypothetical protein SELMODRAFT_146841 [Selaginella moellendorffii]|uniref:Nop domain-containing protein n=1 Tax=Selaginella moellendorffii TaxID=88036 RepID=D8RG17_SELML|nr:probable nucleolar protein 5-2 [Selaginella moellendorffii]EFJ29217.1 hypothetical protein SELMODRAFT_146841 [Selaginella moellendorffii]|eukprot:XP_002970093.1 probable nucleolar protein 5-2 [Selaginella moellendorffii]